MDFMYFTLPAKDAYPRFDNACTKSSQLQARYNIVLGKPETANLQVNKFVKVYLCKKRDETDFPVEINSCIAETLKRRNIYPEKIIKSRNIYSFLNSQEEADNIISLIVVDIKSNKEISKLGKSKFHFILVAEDDHVITELEEELTGSDKPVTVANKGNIASVIDNLLERISLAPLKLICESCYNMLEQMNSAETSTDISHTKSSNIAHPGHIESKWEEMNGLTYAETPTNLHNGLHHMKSSDPYLPKRRYTSSKREKKTEFAHASSQRKNGYAISCDFDQSLEKRTEKAYKYRNEHKPKKINANSHASTGICTRSRSQLYHDRMLNGFKGTDTSTISSGQKEIRGLVRQRSEETDTAATSKDKRRKTEFSDLNGLSYQHSRRVQMKEEENPERLLEAILALYGMSNVPETERPNVPKHSCKVSKEMRNELFRICPSIKRMGYRYRTFYIYAVKPKSQADEERRKKKISSVMKRYGIYSFEIAPCSEHITELMYVGAKIEVRSGTSYSLRSRTISSPANVKGGTLGCFVNMNDGERQCGLLSKHVSEHCSDVYYVGKGNNNRIGHMIEATNKHQSKGLDISAALIHERIGEDGTKFKDTRQTPLKGKLHEYNEEEDAICRRGQPVHIYGAISNPGKGEITMPCVDMRLSTTLIQVEDEKCSDGTAQRHFAEKGDSGAIVCVEDPTRKNVHALSMVIGTPDSEDTARKTYLTLPLSKGLQQLENNTGNTFKLC